MLGLGSTEVMIILVFAFLLFGPDKLPQIGRTLGRAIRQFNETRDKMTSVVQTEVIDPMTATINEPKKAPAPTGDEDADAEGAPSAAPVRKETFAERRARLAAEKAAREAGAADTEQAATGASPDAAADDHEADAGGAEARRDPGQGEDASPVASGASATDPAEGAEEEKPAFTTADLYARRPRRGKARVEDAREEEAPAAEGAAAEQGAPSMKGGER